MKLSIIIVSYGSVLSALEAVAAVVRNTKVSKEVIVFDNASKDSQLLDSIEDVAMVLHSGSNLGLCKARNISVRSATGEYVVFLDDDVIVQPGWEEPIIGMMSSYRRTAICQLELVTGPYNGTGSTTAPAPQSSTITFSPVWYAIGGGMIVRKETFDELGGFDEEMFVQDDDADLCWRAWLSGYDVVKSSGCVAYHHREAWERQSPPNLLRSYYAYRNHIYLRLKNYQPVNAILATFMCAIDGLLFALLVSPKSVVSLLASTKWLIGHPRLIMKARVSSQRLRKRRDGFLKSFASVSDFYGFPTTVNMFRRLFGNGHK